MKLPRTKAAERAAMDDTGCITRMEPIWSTMEALERENVELRRVIESVVKNIPIYAPEFRTTYLYEQCVRVIKQ
jgi:hypothetical protein